MRQNNVLKLTLVGMGIALNMMGAFIALNLRLPIYLDSIGTLMVAFLLGPIYGVATGLCGSVISGVTFDIFSLYFAPVQIFTGFLGGYLYKKDWLKGWKIPFGTFFMTIFVSFIGAVIAAYLFGGVTSSGSSYIVAFLSNIGVNKVVSVFIVQFLTDYLDKLVAVILVSTAIVTLPRSMAQRIEGV
jgi:energy-coupling factor transport system substrate-specific component